jgi:phasin family protein
LEQKAKSLKNGVQYLSQSFIGFAQGQIEETVQTAQKLLKSRSLEEMASIHAQFVQQSFDRLVDGANKMTQKAASFAKDRVEPLNDQMESFVQRMNFTR